MVPTRIGVLIFKIVNNFKKRIIALLQRSDGCAKKTQPCIFLRGGLSSLIEQKIKYKK